MKRRRKVLYKRRTECTINPAGRREKLQSSRPAQRETPFKIVKTCAPEQGFMI